MVAGFDLGADLLQVFVHGLAVAVGHHQAGGGAFFRTDRTEDVGPFRPLILGRGGTGPSPSPPAGHLVLLAYAGFVFEPDLKRGPGRELAADFLDPQGGSSP